MEETGSLPQQTRAPLSRRAFLGRSALVAGAAVGSGALLSACSSDDGGAAASGGGTAGAAGTSVAGVAGDDAYVKAIADRVKGRTVQVGFAVSFLAEFFTQIEGAAFQRMSELEEAYGVKWKWERATPAQGNFDATQQLIQIIQNFATRKYDAVVTCSGGNFATMQNAYQQAKKSGTKIVQFNMCPELYVDRIGEFQFESSIGYDNRWQAGYVAGKFIADTLGGKGKILQVWGPAGSEFADARQTGFDKALEENPGLEVVGKADGGYVRDKGFATAQDLLTRNPDVNAIYGENEDMALGAAQAVDARGLKHWDGKDGIVIIGADGLVSGMEAIRAGKMTASIDVGPVDMGRYFIDAVFRTVVLEESVPRIWHIPTRVVTKENVDSAEAYLKWALKPAKKY
jgi:ABC-type sugar transport system substrate-binding protein